jgi:hypothetical protein
LNGKVAASVKKTDINGRRDPLGRPRDILYPQKLALTSLTSGSCSVSIVRSLVFLLVSGICSHVGGRIYSFIFSSLNDIVSNSVSVFND